MRLARLHRRRGPLGSFFRRIARAACIVWPAPELVRGPDAGGRAGTVASGVAPISRRETVAMKETDLLESHPRRLMPAGAQERSLMGVRAWHAQPDARSGSRWRQWVLLGGDAALALALAAAFYLATGVHYEDQSRGIALILLQTLALRRWYPLSVLAVVVAATLGTVAAEIPGRSNGGVGVVLMVALYSVAGPRPRRAAVWAGSATGAALAWPLWIATAGIAPAWGRLLAAVVSLV